MKIFHGVLPISLLALAACQEEPRPRAELTAPPQAAPPSSGTAAAPSSQGAQPQVSGTVVETMDSGGYTYVQLDAGPRGKVWVAGPSTTVAVGDTVGFAGGMKMQDFASNTLNRTFDEIYFANALQVAGNGAGAAAKPAAEAAPAPADIEVEKAEGGLTVAEIFAKADALAGQEVVVRGKVVKYNAGILGKNWLHVQDGSGEAGANDLTVTTQSTAGVGDVVTIRGTVATDKDYGAGYSYPVIIEDASLTK